MLVFARIVRVPRAARVDRASRRSYMFRAMFWPLAGGLIAFILVAVLLGWILDPSRRGDADRHGPGH
jgi:F0F1-type ATP synthase assembly protein I